MNQVIRPINGAAGFGLFALLVYLFFSGYDIEQQTERSALIAAIWHHIGWAILTLMLSCAVGLWVWQQRRQSRRADKALRDFPVSGWLVVINVFLLQLGGIAMVWFRGSTLKVFDWFALPSPFERMQTAYEWSETLHKGLVVSLLILALIFALQMFMRALNPRR